MVTEGNGIKSTSSQHNKDVQGNVHGAEKKKSVSLLQSPSKVKMEIDNRDRKGSPTKNRTNLRAQGSKHIVAPCIQNTDVHLAIGGGGKSFQNVRNPLSHTRLVLFKTKGKLTTTHSTSGHPDKLQKISQCGISYQGHHMASDSNRSLSSNEMEVVHRISNIGDFESDLEYLQSTTNPFPSSRQSDSGSEIHNNTSLVTFPSPGKSKDSSQHEFVTFVGQKRLHNSDRPPSAKSQTSGYQTVTDFQRDKDDVLSFFSDNVEQQRSDGLPGRAWNNANKGDDNRLDTSNGGRGFLATDFSNQNRLFGDYDARGGGLNSGFDQSIDIQIQPPRPSTQALFQRVTNLNRVTEALQRRRQAEANGENDTIVIDLTTDPFSSSLSRSLTGDYHESLPSLLPPSSPPNERKTDSNNDSNQDDSLLKTNETNKNEKNNTDNDRHEINSRKSQYRYSPPRTPLSFYKKRSDNESPVLPFSAGDNGHRHPGYLNDGSNDPNYVSKPGGGYKLYEPMDLGKAYKEDLKVAQQQKEGLSDKPRQNLDLHGNIPPPQSTINHNNFFNTNSTPIAHSNWFQMPRRMRPSISVCKSSIAMIPELTPSSMIHETYPNELVETKSYFDMNEVTASLIPRSNSTGHFPPQYFLKEFVAWSAQTKQNHHTERKAWLTGRLSTMKDSCRFEIPMDVRRLEGMSPMEYLTKYAVISRRRRMLYKVTFMKYDKDKDGQLTKKELISALRDLHVTFMNNDELELFEEILDIADQKLFSLHEYVSVAAFSERFIQLHSQRQLSVKKRLYKKGNLEKADFSALDYKLAGVKVDSAIRKILEVL